MPQRELRNNADPLTELAREGARRMLAEALKAEADAFVAASFVTLRPAAKAGFLVLGPMFDLKLYMMYTRVFKPKLIWTIIISVVIQVFLYTMILHGFWENLGPKLFFPKIDPITSTSR